MDQKRKFGCDDNFIPLKQMNTGSSEGTGPLTLKFPKNRRPWRNKVRREAAKEARRKQREKESQSTIATGDEIQSKQHQKKKKKSKSSLCSSSNATFSVIGQETNGMAKLNSSLFRYINEQLYSISGAEAMELFQKDPHAFEIYHRGYYNQSSKWPYNPLYGIIQWIRTLKRQNLVIADMGCGVAKIAEKLSHIATVHSFDLVAVNDYVTACDMSKVPLQNGSVDIVVFCLSLMGTNLNEYLREANRLLKKGGFLKIAEVKSRFTSVKQFIHAITKMGFRNTGKLCKDDGYFIILEFVKTGKVVQKRPIGLKLKPCLYKKR
ncbi:unnamed protein product [Thelazia callipaeda]|uniref:Ribosomal RNA-processing protein 8 n=1 Tax=Thelazia callipaeda TaxID=103827 RepID=A0A0N5CWQ4_THECL|nr:unnamed protein product [Thelazia callipaeda]